MPCDGSNAARVAAPDHKLERKLRQFELGDAALMKPLDDGPRWRFNLNAKMRFDENGDLISAKEEFATDEFIRCLGPES